MEAMLRRLGLDDETVDKAVRIAGILEDEDEFWAAVERLTTPDDDTVPVQGFASEDDRLRHGVRTLVSRWQEAEAVVRSD